MPHIVGTTKSELRIDTKTITNIERKFHKNPQDKNLYFAYLFSNIFADTNFEPIFEEGIKKGWNDFNEYMNAVGHLMGYDNYLADDNSHLENRDAYLGNLQRLMIFILKRIDLVFDKALEAAFCWMFCGFLGMQNISISLLIEKIYGKQFLLDEDLNDGDRYISSLILADNYFSKGKVLDAFELYMRLKEFNLHNKIDDSEFKQQIKWQEELYYFDGVVKSITTIDDRIELCVNALLERSEGQIDNIISNAYMDIMVLRRTEREKKNIRKTYEKIARLFECTILGKYDNAQKYLQEVGEDEQQKAFTKKCGKFIKWVKTHKKIRKIKAGTRTEDLLEKVSNYNTPGYELVLSLETMLRKFVKENLKSLYGTKKWWVSGVADGEIKKTCAARREDDSCLYESFAYMYLKDLQKIIKTKANWQGIFGKYFLTERNRNKDKLLSWISEIIPIRNKIMHGRLVKKKELQLLRKLYADFKKIYSKWAGPRTAKPDQRK